MNRSCTIVWLALASMGVSAQTPTAPQPGSPADAKAQGEILQKTLQDMLEALQKSKDAEGKIKDADIEKNLQGKTPPPTPAQQIPAVLTLSAIPQGKNTPYRKKIEAGHRECINKNKGPGGVPTAGTRKCDDRFRELMERPFWRYIVTDAKGKVVACPANTCTVTQGLPVLIQVEGPERVTWTGACATGNLVPAAKVTGAGTCYFKMGASASVGIQ